MFTFTTFLAYTLFVAIYAWYRLRKEKSTNENSLVYGNPQKEKKTLTKNFVSKINNQNKKYIY